MFEREALVIRGAPCAPPHSYPHLAPPQPLDRIGRVARYKVRRPPERAAAALMVLEAGAGAHGVMADEIEDWNDGALGAVLQLEGFDARLCGANTQPRMHAWVFAREESTVEH